MVTKRELLAQVDALWGWKEEALLSGREATERIAALEEENKRRNEMEAEIRKLGNPSGAEVREPQYTTWVPAKGDWQGWGGLMSLTNGERCRSAMKLLDQKVEMADRLAAAVNAIPFVDGEEARIMLKTALEEYKKAPLP